MFEERDIVRNMRRVRDLKIVRMDCWMRQEGVRGTESRRLAKMTGVMGRALRGMCLARRVRLDSSWPRGPYIDGV